MGAGWIITYTGLKINLATPFDNHYDIRDIAHGLSNIGRWVGQTSNFMSVAQHCCVVADLLWGEWEVALQGLMHDAAEAYLGDISNPLKQMLPGYVEIEKKFDAAIASAFNLPTPFNSMVKHADLMSLAQERRDLFQRWEYSSLRLPAPPAKYLMPWTPQKAEIQFSARYYYLSGISPFPSKVIEPTVDPIKGW